MPGGRQKEIPLIAILVGSEAELKNNRGTLALTSTQAAARLEVSERTLRRYVELGRITPHEERCGTLLVFTLSEIDRLREELRARANERRYEY